MVLVGLPDTKTTAKYLAEAKGQFCDELMVKLKDKHRIYTAISFIMGKFWCRLSVQVYNSEDDYFKLRDAVLDVLGDD